MTSTAIHVEQLGKRYRITRAAARHATLGDALAHWLRTPLRNLQRLRRLSRFDGADGADVLWALRDVSFQVREGDALGIVGRNGAGKSTLLKVLTGITDPTTGFADVAGRVGSLLEVGTGFHPELSGRDNVYLNGAILGMDRRYIERKFDEIVEFAGVLPFIDTPVKKYSSGMRLRLAFAVAAHLEPEILIIDEVLAVGDAEFQKKCIGRMDAVAREGRTVLLVSHDLTIVQRLCTRCVLLQSGRLVADGGTNEVIARYLAEGPDQVMPGRWIDLSAVEREGSREVEVRGLWFSSGVDSASGLPYTYGPLEVRLELFAQAAMKLERFLVWLSSPQGAKLLVVDCNALGLGGKLPAGPTALSFRIPSLNLLPGIYGLNVRLRNRREGMFDNLEPACQLQVVDLRDARAAPGIRETGVVPCEPVLTAVSHDPAVPAGRAEPTQVGIS
jgi:lipopolysaccharide transport system ATP-binding protein